MTNGCERSATCLQRRVTSPVAAWADPKSLARAREPEIDLGRARVGPARGHDLGSRVELDALGTVHVQVTEQRVLPAAEAVVRDRNRDRHVDTDHPRLHLELELAGRPPAPGGDRGAASPNG